MRKYVRAMAESLAPTAYGRLRRLSVLDDEDASSLSIYLKLEEEVHDLRRQVDELRRENRRVIELYDLVFERLHKENPLTDRTAG